MKREEKKRRLFIYCSRSEKIFRPNRAGRSVILHTAAVVRPDGSLPLFFLALGGVDGPGAPGLVMICLIVNINRCILAKTK